MRHMIIQYVMYKLPLAIDEASAQRPLAADVKVYIAIRLCDRHII